MARGSRAVVPAGSVLAVLLAGRAPSARRHALPRVEGARERVQLLEAEDERDLAGSEVGVDHEATSGVPAHLVEQLLVARSRLPEAALEGAWTHPYLARHLLDAE